LSRFPAFADYIFAIIRRIPLILSNPIPTLILRGIVEIICTRPILID